MCDGLRDLAHDVERNEKYKNVDQMGAGAATTHSSACNAEITKSDFKNPSKTFFSQEKISLMRTMGTRERVRLFTELPV
jgi:hypothetical protein